MSKLIPIDFEYRGTNEFNLDLICCSMEVEGKVEEYWVYASDSEKLKLKNRLLELRDKYIFTCWNVLAEGHAFISLGLNPIKFKWIDLQIEWKMCINHNHKYMYGDQYMNGKIIKTFAPSYGQEKTVNNAKAKTNLAAGVYKLLGEIIDTDHKDEMRNVCIYGSAEDLARNRKQIQDYCTSDIKYLKPMWKTMASFVDNYFKTIDISKNELPTIEEVLFRGECGARTAYMQALGYPVDYEATRKFADSVKDILKDLCEDINSQFEEPFFIWNKREGRYSFSTKKVKEWISKSEYKDKWLRTDPTTTKPNGDYSLKLEAWEKHFSYSHDYPRNFLPAQVLRYLKTRRSLNGFLPKSDNAKSKENIFDAIGSDHRCRAYLNPYGSQSARFQPGATAFIPLKAAWTRSLILPKKGRAIAGIDYASQEFLISAYLSKDKNMIEAYRSGDVYLYFAKLAGAVPWEGKKEEYKDLRNLFKATTLGISYSMGEHALAAKLTNDTGRKVDVKEANSLIQKFYKAFPDYAEYVNDVRWTYKVKGYWKLADGWVMFGGNDNERSISNLPVQGMGSCILRKAIELCQDKGLQVIYPLHDALYIEYDSHNFDTLDIFASCMKKAFSFYFEDKQIENDIRLDCDTWSLDYEDSTINTPNGLTCKVQKRYIDERSINEFNRFKKYMFDS